MSLNDIINQGRGVSNIQLTKSIIESYSFMDYGIVKTYTEGFITVVPAHKVGGKSISLTSIEVLSVGSKGLTVKHTLVEGDIVMLFSSKTMVPELNSLSTETDIGWGSYDTLSIKALPLGLFDTALNTLDIASDGSYTLKGDKYSISMSTAGDLSIDIKGAGLLKAAGKYEIKGSTVELNGNSKFFVTHTELNTALQSLMTSLAIPLTLTATAPPGGGPVVGTASWASPPTIDITSAKTTTVKTGG